MIATRKFRVHVRNKNRYNPETKERNFLFVDINDFAGTTIGDIKEDVRRQSRGAIRIDELFLDNQSLADDRSVAHYNLEDDCILETTSNPFWVACLYIKASEVRQEMEGNPNDKHIQEWTQKSLPKKYTLIGLLLNAKNEYGRQPPHFATLDEFAIYLERLKKKSATMHPDYTQKDMRAFEREFQQEFLGRYDDPIAAFIDHHAVRLGHALPDEIEQRPLNRPNEIPRNVHNTRNIPAAGKPKPGGRKRQERYCDDCEEALAEVYCAECQGGLAMCRRCSTVLHAGASRRRHNLQDIEQAPSNSSKPYVPRAFLAPFSIVLAMYNALNTQSILSLTEDEIKRRAQPLTDTDLQDKQAGKYVGGFDCMENVLMNKGLVKKEAARVPTYALSETGQVLGQKLYTFYTQFYRFMESCRLPKVHNNARNGIINNRKLCLIVDENERDKQRLLRYAAEKNIDAQVRLLPAGDYIWILSPPMMDPQATYTGKDYADELVLPFVVERKSWADFENSTNSGRFKRQINNMLGCGLANSFYLMEGSTSGLRNNATQHHQQYLKGLLEKLVTENGFFVNYTSSWMKSAQWILWFTGFLVDGWRTGVFQDSCISYQEYMSRVARQRGNTVTNAIFRNARRLAHTWKAPLFVDHIIRDSHGERRMMSTVKEDLGVTSRSSKHLLVIQNLEQYNKKRQSALSKCCEAVCTDPGQARDIVEDKLGPNVHNMLHYDIASYWQLYMQVMTGVYVVRTETDQDTENIHRIFTSTFTVNTPPVTFSTAVPKATNRRPTNTRRAPKTATITSPNGGNQINDDPMDIGPGLLSRRRNPSDPLMRNCDDDNGLGVHRNVGIHSIISEDSKTPSFNLFNEGNEEGRHSTAGHVIKKGRRVSENDNDFQRWHTTVENHTIQPFSGQGYCLGTQSLENIPRFEKAVNKTKGPVQNPVLNNSPNQGICRAGLVGGMWSSRNNSGNVGGTGNGSSDDSEGEDYDRGLTDKDQAVRNNDFVDSQNEDEIMKEILEKSAAEAKEMSNEDEMLKLAVEMSKQKSAKKISDGIRNNLTDDEEFQLALEMSKASEKDRAFKNQLPDTRSVSNLGRQEETNDLGKNSVVNLSEEEELKHVLEMSKSQTRRFKEKPDSIPGDRIELGDNENEDEMVKLAIKMSMSEQKNSKRGEEKKLLPSIDEEEVLLVPDTEEGQMKLALEVSRKETPKKLQDDSYRRTNEITDEHRKLCKRKIADSELSSEHAGEMLSEEEQLKIAMELSMSQIVKEKEKSSDNAKNDLGENAHNANKFMLSKELGVSSCKKSKHDQNYNRLNREATENFEVEQFLDEPSEANERVEKNNNAVFDEDLKKALERSKVEHSLAKKVKLGQQVYDEDELMKIIIERSKVEHSPLKKTKIEKSKEKVVSLGTSSIEVIEINSQNSQERDDDTCIDVSESDLLNVIDIDSCSQKDTGTINFENRGERRKVCSNKRVMCSSHSPTVFTDIVCGGVEEGRDFEHEKNRISFTGSAKGPRNSAIGSGCSLNSIITDRCAGAFIPDTDESSGKSPDSVKLENVEEDGDFIPPSPGRSGSPGNSSFSQTFFSKTPENFIPKPMSNRTTSCSSDRPSLDTFQTCVSGWKCTDDISGSAINESLGNLENEVCDAVSKSVNSNKKFDLKSSLFYDSDESDSESEADIFDIDEQTDSKVKLKENEISIERSDRNDCLVIKDFDHQNIGKEVDRGFQVNVALEKKNVDKVLLSISESKQHDEGIGHEDQNFGIAENVFLPKNDHAKIDKRNVNAVDDYKMSDADPQIQEDYLDYDDDNNDIDYQPDSQEFNVESGSGSEEGSGSDLEENSQERNDLDLLPLIRRPRKIRYRQLKEEEEKVYALKRKEKELEQLKGEIKIKTEVIDQTDQDENELTADEIYARQLQEKLDREARQAGERRSSIDDAYIARQLYETLNKEPAPSDKEVGIDNFLKLQSAVSNRNVYNSVDNGRTNADEVSEHSVPKHNSFGNFPAVSSNKGDTSKRLTESGRNPEAVVRELQRRELEKIERWRKMLMEDEKLAQRLQEMQGDKEEEAASITGESQSKSSQTQQVDTSFRKMVAQHKASKEKAMVQLQQYKNLQIKRFQEVHNRPHSTFIPSNSGGNAGENNDVVVVKETQDKFLTPGIPSINNINTRPTVTAPVNRTHFSENRQFIANGSPSCTHTVNHMNQSITGVHTAQNSQSQPSSGSHMSQFNQSQSVDGDHVTQSSQSQSIAIKHSNVTCGNCGEKGHNRTFQKCSKYHTAEESARREAKIEKQRQQKEEKRKQEVETIDMLSEHKQMLEDMTSQIQKEMGTIQNRLQQRTSQLEAQVNLRVKKIENANKKKKK